MRIALSVEHFAILSCLATCISCGPEKEEAVQIEINSTTENNATTNSSIGDCEGAPDFRCCGEGLEVDAVCSADTWECPVGANRESVDFDCGAPSNNATTNNATTNNALVWPNGDPAANTLYFSATDKTGGFGSETLFDTFHTGMLTTCDYDGITLVLRTGPIPDGALSFSLEFQPAFQGASFDLDPGTQLDWSHPDGASAFFYWADPTVDVESSGHVQFAECGAEIAGVFELRDVAEYHTVSSGAWLADIVGAFRCAPTLPVDCGL